MSVPTRSCVPRYFEQGETVRFAVSDGDFPADDWDLSIALNDGAHAPLVVDAEASGQGFIVELDAESTTALVPGAYTYGEIYTAKVGGDVARGRSEAVEVVPGIGLEATPTAAQANVTRLQAAIAKLSASANSSVNFSGQSYTRASLGEYQRQLVYWQSRVIAERARVDAIRGIGGGGGSIGIHFCDR